MRITYLIPMLLTSVLGLADEKPVKQLPLTIKSDEVSYLVPIGQAFAGTRERFSVSIKNQSGVPLEIESISRSCGCILTGPVKQSSPQGGGVQFPIELILPNSAGDFDKRLTIACRGADSALRSFEIRLTGRTLAPFILTPLAFEFEHREDKIPYGVSLTVESQLPERITEVRVMSTTGMIQFETAQTIVPHLGSTAQS